MNPFAALGLVPILLDKMGQNLLASVPPGVTAAQLTAAIAAATAAATAAIAAAAATAAAALAAALAALPAPGPPAKVIDTTLGFGVVTTTLNYPAGPLLTTTGGEGVAQRVFCPAGSTWRTRLAVDGAVAAGETLTLQARYSVTVNSGVWANLGAAITRVAANGTASVDSAVLTPPAAGFLTMSLVYSNIAGLFSQSHMELERVS